ncbi:MAG: hypothetical protein ACJARP_002174, partial [Vicingaceae bacterium]
MKFRLLLLLLTFSASPLFAHKNEGFVAYTFTENNGQWHKIVTFKAEVEGATVFFEKNAFHYQF